jgi:hypothetical protein
VKRSAVPIYQHIWDGNHMKCIPELQGSQNKDIILRLIDYLQFYVPRKNVSLIWRRHHAGEGLPNLGLCSALRSVEQGGIFIVTRGFGFSGLIRRAALFSCLLWHTRECGGSILTWILSGTLLWRRHHYQ